MARPAFWEAVQSAGDEELTNTAVKINNRFNKYSGNFSSTEEFFSNLLKVYKIFHSAENIWYWAIYVMFNSNVLFLAFIRFQMRAPVRTFPRWSWWACWKNSCQITSYGWTLCICTKTETGFRPLPPATAVSPKPPLWFAMRSPSVTWVRISGPRIFFFLPFVENCKCKINIINITERSNPECFGQLEEKADFRGSARSSALQFWGLTSRVSWLPRH